MLDDELLGVARTMFLSPSSRLYWPYLLLYVGIAAVAVRVAAGGRTTWRASLAEVFPRRIYAHRSFRLDAVLFALQLVLTRLGVFSLAAYVVTGLSREVVGAVRTAFPALAAAAGDGPVGWGDRVVFTLVAVAAFDLGYFLVHLAMHRVPALWAFHKVHHSAEHLNPLTAWRQHPVDYVLNVMAGTFLATLAVGLFTLWHGVEVQVLTVLNLSAVYFVFLLTANLRHSHVWIGFGPWASRVFVSPAMHQIHHGTDRRHLDRNYGVVFSLWDGLAGSRYVPREREDIRFGLRGRTALSSADPLYVHLLRPFAEAWRLVRKGSPWRWRHAASSAAPRHRTGVSSSGDAAPPASVVRSQNPVHGATESTPDSSR